MDFEKALATMEAAAADAGRMLVKLQPKSQQLASRKDFLTDADLASEKIIISTLQKNFPEIAMYSEEAGGNLSQKGFQWVIDPVDGTWMYFKGLPTWGVSIALIEDGQPRLGVIALPSQQITFSASWNIDMPNPEVKASNTTDLQEALILTDWTKPGYPDVTLKILDKLARGTRYPSIIVSSTYCMMQVALGKADGYICPAPAIEDHAAAGLIVQKSGGKVTDFEGNPWTPFSKSIVATNGQIHDQLLALLN